MADEIQLRTSDNVLAVFDKQLVVESLLRETKLDKKQAVKIADEVEQKIKGLNLKYPTAPLVREIVNYVLLENGLEEERMRYTRLGMPVHDVKELIFRGSDTERVEEQHNPETIHKLMADVVAREYAYVGVVKPELVDAHMAGHIHIHNLNYFATRPYSFSHDLRFFFKNGLKVDGTGEYTSVAGPAKTPEVAFLHAAKILSSSQIDCAGAQGLPFFNTLLAPYVRGLDAKHVKQLAQIFIYDMSQKYMARGGQGVFSSIDVDLEIPRVLKDQHVVHAGKLKSATYADYEEEAKALYNAMIDVFLGGDYAGNAFNFPRLTVKIDPKNVNEELLHHALELAGKYGNPYFLIMQDYLPKLASYQFNSYLMPTNGEEDTTNGTIRGGVIEIVTVNLPRVAYHADGEDSTLFNLLRERMESARDVLLEKKEVLYKGLANGLLPFLSQPVNSKKTPYMIPEKQNYLIGFVGLNELVKAHTDHELHEPEGLAFGKKVIEFMSKTAEEFTREHGVHFVIAGSRGEKMEARLAPIDVQKYGSKAVVQKDFMSKKPFYTNSFQARDTVELDPLERLKIEAEFHPVCSGGAISHVHITNESKEQLVELTEEIASLRANHFNYAKI